MGEKKAVTVHSLTMYNYLVCRDGSLADENTPQAVCQWKILEDGVSLYAMQPEVLGQSFKFDT